MTKQEKIKAFLEEPLKVGDKIYYRYINSKGAKAYEIEPVVKIDNDFAYIKRYGYNELDKIKLSEVEKYVNHIGVNPFAPEIRHDSYSIDIEQLLWRCGYDRIGKSRMEEYFNVNIPEVCFNPMVIDENGNEVEYQRGLVWTLEQKQLLIESIYNNIEIGKFVFRSRAFNWVKKRIKDGKLEHTAFKDLVDGKQRVTAILEFIENKFPDLNGIYFDEFSENSKRHFMSYRHLFYVEMDERTTDKDVLNQFLKINFAGVPMSREHIEFVKTIKI